MTQSMITTLVAKDLHLNRVFIVGSVLAGLLSVAIATLGETGFTIGSIMFITNIVALGIFLGIYSVVQEREKRTHVFVYSLPVSTRQYYVAKMTSALISFGIPWVLSGAAAIIAISSIDTLPNGLLPLLVLLLGFFLHNFCIFLSVSLTTQTEFWVVATVLFTNMSISLFFPLVGSVSSIGDNVEGPVAVWSPAVFAMLAAEFAVASAALCVALAVISRKKDFL